MANGSPRVKRMKSKVKSHESSMAGSFYKQIDPRLKQQLEDSRMMQEDEYAIANLSPRFINKIFNPDRFKEALGGCDERNDIGR